MWMRGDFRCALDAADHAMALPEHADDVRLMRVRVECLRRLRRTADAVAYARSIQVAPGRPDFAQRALLLGLALVSTAAWQESDDVLAEALAHSAIAERDEIVAYRALTVMYRGEYEAALEMLRSIPPGDTLPYVKRLENEATIAHLRLELDAAAGLGEEALTRLMRIPHERLLELKLLSFVGNLACERLDIEGWLRIARRYGDLQAIPEELWYPRFAAHRQQSTLLEMVGNPRDALRSADAMLAPSLPVSLQLQGMCRKALILLRYGEQLAFHDVAESIRRYYCEQRIDAVQHPVESQAFLMIAEVLASDGDPDAAGAVLEDLANHAHMPTPWQDYSADRAELEYVSGVIADARGHTLRARRLYRSAFETLRRLGFQIAALIAAHRLMELDRDADVVRYVDERARAFAPDSWIRRGVNRHIASLNASALRDLSRAERGVLDLLLQGKSTAQIARQLDRSDKTIRNTISALLKTFGVENRQALLCECLRRGMGPIL